MSIDPNKKRWGCNFSEGEIADARMNGRLLTMELETSHQCNLRCVYCYNSSGRKQSNELSLAEMIDVIEQGIDLGVRRVIVIGGGEPMMHPDIMRILEFLNKKGLGIDLFTNGTLLNHENAKALYDLGVEPVLKLNSLRPEVQDLLADHPGTYDAIQRGLEALAAVGYPDAGHDLGVESIICAQNYDEIPTMWRWARSRAIVPYFEMITFQGRARQRLDLNVAVPDLEKLFRELSRIDREEFGFVWEPHPPIAALTCSRHEYSCTITASGYVQPCTGVDIKVGNIRHAPLREILKDNVVVDCMRNVREHVKGACAGCVHAGICYGCRGLAYHVTGDFLAADPLCWRNPNHLK